MYKAIFHLAPTRVEFLALLFSAPPPARELASEENIDKLLQFIAETPVNPKAFEANLARFAFRNCCAIIGQLHSRRTTLYSGRRGHDLRTFDGVVIALTGDQSRLRECRAPHTP